MKRPIGLSALPEIECTAEGATVRIDSRGSPGLVADLGPEGPGLEGEVRVEWNGREVYRGPARTIRLGSADDGRVEDDELSCSPRVTSAPYSGACAERLPVTGRNASRLSV